MGSRELINRLQETAKPKRGAFLIDLIVGHVDGLNSPAFNEAAKSGISITPERAPGTGRIAGIRPPQPGQPAS